MPFSQLIKFLSYLLITVGMVACGTTSPSAPPSVADRETSVIVEDNSIARTLQLAERAESPEREAYLLDAVARLLDSNRDEEAKEILQRIDALANLPADLRARYVLLNVESALRRGEAEAALALLQGDLLEPLPSLAVDLQVQVLELRSRALLELRQYIAAVRERLLMLALLSVDGIQSNNDKIWQILSSAPESALLVPNNQIDSYELRGWLELIQVVNANLHDMAQQITAVAQWRNKWVQHSAAGVLPESLSYVHQLWNNRARHIALLLPMAEPAGRAISEGFLGAYFDALEQGQEVPTISVYDTSPLSEIMPTYRLATERGAQLIIGPLRKDLVRELQSQSSLPVPTLALNYGDSDRLSPAGLYQFGLAPEDEIMQAADMAWAAGHRNAAVLVPMGADYQRIHDIFTTYWQQLGGRVITQASFAGSGSYSDIIKQLLSIDASEARSAQLRSLLPRSTLHFTPRRRQDVDFIFLSASPLEGRQIKPTLAFHFAGDVPVYAMPGIYDGGINPVANRDLNGILFTDSPWILQPQEPLRDAMDEIWPAAASPVQRLRAMGVDSFRLHARLEHLHYYPDARVQGATGMLSMQANGGIKRELLEAQILNGNASIMNLRNRRSNAAVSSLPQR